MSTLSKIFVVMNFVLAICFMVASLTLYAKKVNWVNEARKNVVERNRLHKRLKNLQRLYDETVDDDMKTILKKDKRIEALKTNITDLNEALTREKNANSNLVARLRSFDANLKELQTNLTRQQKRNVELEAAKEQLSKERDTAIAAREFAETQAIESMADLKEAEAELLQLSKRNHSLISRTMEQDVLLDKARERGFDPRMVLTGDINVPAVAGRVLQVEEAVGIAILSVGKKNKVRPGMEFVISRGDKYIGKVRVRNIYEDMCSAVILQDLTKEPIQVNDLAQTINN